MKKQNNGNQGGNQGKQDNQGGKGNQGFASMDDEKQREIAAKGGRASQGGNSKDDDMNQGKSKNASDKESDGNRSGGQGFAGMDEERQREIASMGGKAAHASGNAHEFTSEEAREAGRKGGQASQGNRSGNDKSDK
jgi:general stress protein YciG